MRWERRGGEEEVEVEEEEEEASKPGCRAKQ